MKSRTPISLLSQFGLIGCALLAGLPLACRDRDRYVQTEARDAQVEMASGRVDREDPLTLFRRAFGAKDWESARLHSESALVISPHDADLLTQVATAVAFSGEKRKAAELLVEAAREAKFQPRTRVDYALQALIDVGDLYAAIELLQEMLVNDPESDRHRKILVGFLSEAQRTDLIAPHYKVLIRRRIFDLPLLLSVTDTSSRRLSNNTVAKMVDRNPTDLRVRLSDAFAAMYSRDSKSASEILTEVLNRHPEFEPAHAMLGQALVASQQWHLLSDWLEKSPAGVGQFPDYWVTLGDIQNRKTESEYAIRCYWEATRRDPNHLIAWSRLHESGVRWKKASALLAVPEDEAIVGRMQISEEDLELIQDRVQKLLNLQVVFNDFAAGKNDQQKAAIEVSKSLTGLGRSWEAEAWAAYALTLVEEPYQGAEKIHAAAVKKLRQDESWFAISTPATALNFGAFPETQISKLIEQSRSDEIVNTLEKPSLLPLLNGHNHLRLVDESLQWGLRGVGGGNCPEDPSLAPLIRSTGAGGGATDMDLDGLPDLVVVNAGGDILQENSRGNQLLRNIGDRFQHVGELAGASDKGFGQGVAIGDLNGDGWGDLIFANLGRNRILLNNADGTYSDLPWSVAVNTDERWSTSACAADFNGDGLMDWMATNYCQIEAGLEDACPNDDGELGPCHPLKFTADTDSFWLATAQGAFEPMVFAEDAIVPGRGLGVIAGALHADSGWGCFVANDMSRNSMYVRRRESDGGISLVDQSVSRGVAVDGRSQTQASMGIAATDFDRDGDLDFYVTGFAREYNVYYEQSLPGFWADRTGQYSMLQPTLRWVGFGTQAVDLDNDGLDELVVANGHIGRFSDPESPPYEQPMQFFRRDDRGSFEEINSREWGGYFSTDHVGRALWKADVNRDGKLDLVVTHVSESTRLLINRSKIDCHVIAFTLVGTSSNRDAIGAVLRLRSSNGESTLFVVSGDGYLCSNEKILVEGLGQAAFVQNVEVVWPNGDVELFGDLSADKHYQLVEGSGKAFVLQPEFDGVP